MTRASTSKTPKRLRSQRREHTPTQSGPDLGIALRSYRELKGLTLGQLVDVLAARGVLVSPAMISNIENGVNRGSFPMRRRLLDFLAAEGQG